MDSMVNEINQHQYEHYTIVSQVGQTQKPTTICSALGIGIAIPTDFLTAGFQITTILVLESKPP